MAIRLPAPLHGWREFVGEVGIIVLGVLIALGAQQIVETRQTHQRIKETRAALDAELSRNLAAFEWRVSQRPCLQARVDELDRWATAMAGKPVTLRNEITPPRYFALNKTVWQASQNDAGQMPVETKLNYASMYAALGTLDENVFRDEQQAWDSISG